MPQTFEQIIPLCIEDLPILLFLSCRKYILGDKYDIVMNRLEGSLLSLYSLFSVCRITGTFVARQSTGIHFEQFIRVRIGPLSSPRTKALWQRRQNGEDSVPTFSSLTPQSAHFHWHKRYYAELSCADKLCADKSPAFGMCAFSLLPIKVAGMLLSDATSDKCSVSLLCCLSYARDGCFSAHNKLRAREEEVVWLGTCWLVCS